jgi:hypothetical protein
MSTRKKELRGVNGRKASRRGKRQLPCTCDHELCEACPFAARGPRFREAAGIDKPRVCFAQPPNRSFALAPAGAALVVPNNEAHFEVLKHEAVSEERGYDAGLSDRNLAVEVTVRHFHLPIRLLHNDARVADFLSQNRLLVALLLLTCFFSLWAECRSRRT